MDKSLRSSLKMVHIIFGIFYAVICSMLIFGPFVRMFDRTDIWVAGMPLSQFGIFFGSLLISVGMAVHYYVEKGVCKSWRQKNGK